MPTARTTEHNLARLRKLINLGQREMAALAGCSIPTIKAVEYGKLALSEKLAHRMSIATGVDLHWLLENDLTKPPRTPGGDAYTSGVFEAVRAANDYVNLDSALEIARAEEYLLAVFGRLYRLWLDLGRKRDASLPIARWRLDRFLTNMEQVLGGEAGRAEREEWRGLNFTDQVQRGEVLARRVLMGLDNPEKIALKQVIPRQVGLYRKRASKADAGKKATLEPGIPLVEAATDPGVEVSALPEPVRRSKKERT